MISNGPGVCGRLCRSRNANDGIVDEAIKATSVVACYCGKLVAFGNPGSGSLASNDSDRAVLDVVVSATPGQVPGIASFVVVKSIVELFYVVAMNGNGTSNPHSAVGSGIGRVIHADDLVVADVVVVRRAVDHVDLKTNGNNLLNVVSGNVQIADV